MIRPAGSINPVVPADLLKQCTRILIAFCMVILGNSSSGAQSTSIPSSISIEKGGKVWINGSAGPINFKCNAKQLSGAGEIQNTTNPQATVKGEGNVAISVKLPVKALSCGKRAMNKDMYKALKSEQFPTIRYRLLDAKLADDQSDTVDQWMNIRTHGIMEVAGVEDTTAIDVQGKLLGNNRFQVKGHKKIHMSTYQIDPPRAMFGLIKADEELTVYFDATVNLDNQQR